MERTGDILKRIGISTSTSRGPTDTSSGASGETETRGPGDAETRRPGDAETFVASSPAPVPARESREEEISASPRLPLSPSGEEGGGEAVCPICKGVGYVRRDVPYGHPDFGRAIPCECKEREADEVRVAHLLAASNLGPLQRHTFDTIIEGGRSGDPARQERFRRTLTAARAYAEQPEGWLVLVGPSGCGKTHLAAAIANHQIRQGTRVFFAIVPDLLDHLRQTFHPESPLTYDQLFQEVRNCPLLILDDLGTQRNTAWAEEKLFQVVNHRYNAQLPTVLTTNCSLDELNERVRSRLTDPSLCQVCIVEDRESEVLTRLGNLDLLAKMRFSTFDLKRHNCTADQLENLAAAFKVARGFVENPEGWLIFQGDVGCGKTHLAAAIAHERQRRGEDVLFVVVPDLLDYLRSTYRYDSAVTYDEVFETLRNVPVLILDDLGAQSSTPWAREKLFQLLNHRYMAQLPTVITTNCTLAELEPRLASRMADVRVSTTFAIAAPDFRSDPKHSNWRAPGKGRGRR